MNINQKCKIDGREYTLHDLILHFSKTKALTPDLTWNQITKLINKATGLNHNESTYRRYARDNAETPISLTPPAEEELNTSLSNLQTAAEIRKARVRLSDERVQNNALVRVIAREESIKEIAKEVAQEISKTFTLKDFKPIRQTNDSNKEAILTISDWHYGIDINNYFNVYNPEVAKDRINELRDKVVNLCHKEKVNKLYIINLQDLIAGHIHLPLRINSRIDVITQVIQVSELLTQFICDIAEFIPIEYYECIDNHSRIEPNKKESIQIESLVRITGWYLKTRLEAIKHIVIHTCEENSYGEDVISTRIYNDKYLIGGVHGDKDSQTKVISNINLLTQTHHDLILTAHLHHFSANEENETLRVSNGSLMGTDQYAKDLRLNSKPSQNLIIVDDTSVMSCLYKINLN